MIQVFNIIRSSSIDFNFDAIVIVVVDVDKSIIESSKNIDYFNSKYENSFEKKFWSSFLIDILFIVTCSSLLIHWKIWKKKFSNFKIKKYVVDCMKNDIFEWHSIEFNFLKKNLLKDVIVDQWCETLIQRFKERDVVALKKFQSSFYIFFDVRNDKTSRVYV